MPRFRIIPVPHLTVPGQPFYEVEQFRPVVFGLGFWDYVQEFGDLESAKDYVKERRRIFRVIGPRS